MADVPRARDLHEYWARLRAGECSIQTFSVDQALAAGVPQSVARHPNQVLAHGYLEDADRFDAGLFGVSPREAEIKDPQQRLFLECSWAALEDAGYGGERGDLRVSVFAGPAATLPAVHVLGDRRAERADEYAAVLGSAKDFIATRVAYKLDLTGPAVTVADRLLDLAGCRSPGLREPARLRKRPGDRRRRPRPGPPHRRLPVDPRRDLLALGLLSSLRRRRRRHGPWQGGAVRAPALDDALADGDRLRAVILGSAMNNDGRARAGFTAPSLAGQADAVAEALERSQVDPRSLVYIETHGTATELGDAIEIAA